MTSTRKNILIVEDEVLIARQIQKTLELNNYNCIGICVDYTSAIQKLETHAVDLVLLDVNLNGKKTGIDLAKYINQKSSIPFLFLTSYSDRNTLSKLKLCSPIGYLNKPFNDTTLLTNIEIFFDSESNLKNLMTPIKYGAKVININIQELIYVESDHIYLNFYFINRLSTIRLSLSKFLQQIPNNQLIQINRSVVINPNLVNSFSQNKVKINDKTFKISELHKENYNVFFLKFTDK